MTLHPQKPIRSIGSQPVLTGGSYIALFNAGESTAQYSLDLKSIDLEGEHFYTELWSAVEGTGSSISCNIPPHGAKSFYLR